MSGAEAFHAALQDGIGSVARAWAVTRRDGVVHGFTDHDRDLSFEGIIFKADTGLSARALQQGTGLSVDNTEAMGGLSDAAITEEDIVAGRYDEAEVVSWLVNWQNVAARRILFRGYIGELRRGNGAFHAELRGLTDRLNRPIGRIFQKPCSAVLGDKGCKFDVSETGYFHDGAVVRVEDGREVFFEDMSGFEEGWFQRGRLDVLTGVAAGLSGIIKRDETQADGTRRIDLWEPMRAELAPGDTVKLIAGCDKRFETCRLKFNNVVNFRGFPDIPEEDWIFVHATQAKKTGGGSRR